MNRKVYDITNILGLILIVIGVCRAYGIDFGLLTGGILLIVLNLIAVKIGNF